MNNNLSKSELKPVVDTENKSTSLISPSIQETASNLVGLTPPSIQETVSNLVGLTPSSIPAENKSSLTSAIPLQIPISNMSQNTSTTLDFTALPVKQTTGSQILSSITTNKSDNVSNVPDGNYKGLYDTNNNPSYFPQTTETVIYSTSCSSNYITHFFLVVIAIYIALRRNGGFGFSSVAAFFCPHIYILYAFYNGFCATP